MTSTFFEGVINPPLDALNLLSKGYPSATTHKYHMFSIKLESVGHHRIRKWEEEKGSNDAYGSFCVT